MSHPEFSSSSKATIFSAQRTQGKAQGTQGYDVDGVLEPNEGEYKPKLRRIAWSKSHLCAPCAFLVSFVLKNCVALYFQKNLG